MKQVLWAVFVCLTFFSFDGLEKTKSILVILAHPDDETAMGPLLAKYGEKHNVHLVVATDGRYGTQLGTLPAGDSLAAVRKKETECSCKALGIRPPVFLETPDGLGMFTSIQTFFRQTKELKEKIKQQIEKIQPDLIISFGPDGDTGHGDHRIIGDIVTEIVLREGWYDKYPVYYLAWTKNQADYLGDLNYVHHSYMNVSESFSDVHEKQSWAAIKCHKSQFSEKEIESWVAKDEKDRSNTLHFRKLSLSKNKRKSLL